MAASSASASASASASGPGPSVAATGSSSSATPGNDKEGSPKPDPTATIPVRSKETFDKIVLNRYIERDLLAASGLVEADSEKKKISKEYRDKIDDYRKIRTEYRQWFPPSKLFGEGYSGYGNGFTENPQGTRIVYPMERKRPGKRSVPNLKWRRKDLQKQAEQPEELVPVRLDIEWDKVKIRDTFTWNLHDRLISVDIFARQLIEDLGLLDALGPQNTRPIYDQIMQQMHEQLNDFYPFAYAEEDALDPELPYSAYKNDEMRILVKLNITLGQHTLVDQFEWEINNPANSPEEFAQKMANELSLSGEFTTAIAHCIREQTQLFTRSLYSVGHPFDGRPVEDPDLVGAFLPSPLPAVFRPQQQAKEYTPYLYEMSEADLERNELVISREQRRQKRSVNRRGGPSLPDLKERQRTIRTLVVSSVIPGAAPSIDESRIFKRPAGAPGARRKGAGARDGEISDSDDSEDSAPESPAPSNLATGTARTRGIRNAALGAQQRMANLGRSETPEAASIVHHHHETRTNRRVPRDGSGREGTEEPAHLIVKLRVSPEKLKRLLLQPRQRTTSNPQSTLTATPVKPPVPPIASMPPPAASTPSATPSAPTQAPTPTTSQAGQPPKPPAPPPPEWLFEALKGLLKQYPYDKFEGTMKYSPVNPNTDPPTAIPPSAQLPDNVVYQYLPRIRCLDCPGKLYQPGPEETVGNFEVHLKNRQHRERVDGRVGKPTGKGAAPPAASS